MADNQQVSAREQALLDDPEMLASVQRGLEQAAAGDIVDLGDFDQYADDEAAEDAADAEALRLARLADDGVRVPWETVLDRPRDGEGEVGDAEA